MMAHCSTTIPQKSKAKIPDGNIEKNGEASVSLSATYSQTRITATVLYDFQGENDNELAVTKDDAIEIVKSSSQGKCETPQIGAI